ncbi:hypothetical protein BABINDRAFT_169934 [Babjeviella inositovora NRRL Y-12698]|uniref:Sulfhydryl oxidase n=1 Tax=Babjeviella inositovora NRRL Y-12698 TaxID=984486 RepID=A0A1E3QYI9_9ASCO|nr:uncharacterized protein BABINDRAFT_169934 [Babjeviella inositovora NRRL Y-12698]ODQ82749.1 hypothetical protein BABINDRAFT_169934 [Babjeviella inositovora NRRL Y-12698]
MPEFGPTGRRIIYKDGKPCRSCNTLLDFQMAMPGKAARPAVIAADLTAPVTVVEDKQCPPDVELLGRSSWTLLHSIAASYPANPSPIQQEDIKTFVSIFSRIYPCWFCADDFQAYIKKNEVQVKSQEAFGKWMCEAHNEVNRKLGKKEFDCNLWQQRWKDGWKGDN